MTIRLQDPALERDPTSRHAFPEIRGEAELRAARTLGEELLAVFSGGRLESEASFELASHGGYARSVTGTVAYLDEEAHTFMVRDRDGVIVRVPLRDVTSAVFDGSSERDPQPRSERDAAGAGTGWDRSSSA